MAGRAATDDALLGGRVRLRQPADGYRVSVDAVLLAACVAAGAGQRALDVGCGAGGAAMCLAARIPEARIHGIDRDGALIGHFRANAEANGFAGRLTASLGDVGNPPPEPLRGAFDHVFSNPPYLPPRRADVRAAGAADDAANIETVPLSGWLAFMAGCAAPGGRMTVIHRADRLDEVLAGLAGTAGAIRLFPLWPHSGEPAKRIIVAARKGKRSPLIHCAGLVLHEADGAFTRAARGVIEDGAPLALE